MRQQQLALAATFFATSLIFGLPHIVIPALLGPGRPYTPFAVSGVSSVTYDETATYAALTNYAALRFKPPYDTDIWESRDIAVPVSTVPVFALAVLDRLSGGLANAFVLSDFVLPALAALILYVLLTEFTRSRRSALIGAFATIFISFGPRNFLGVPWLLLSGQQSEILQPLEYSRLLHPELSFTLLAAAMLFLWRTLHYGRRVDALLGGLTGGLLFYTYVYYFPIWLGACTLLLFARRWVGAGVWRSLCLVNVTTWLVSAPFWVSTLTSLGTQNFGVRLARHYSEVGHLPPPEKLAYTAAYCVVFAIITISFARFHQSAGSSCWKQKVLMFHTAVFGAGIAAMNSEVVLGFNLEAMNHFPNRFFQPFLMLSGVAMLATPLAFVASRALKGTTARSAGVVSMAILAALLTTAATRQIVVSINVADKHELQPEYRLLLDWLNSNSNVDDVVLASARELNDLIPVFTHNLVFVPNGERTSVADREVELRFLLGMRLLQRPANDVLDLVSQDYSHGDPPLGLTYTYFLFVSGNGSYNRALPESSRRQLLSHYRALDVARELGQRRLDYVYAHGFERPQLPLDWSVSLVYTNGFGNLWRVSHDI